MWGENSTLIFCRSGASQSLFAYIAAAHLTSFRNAVEMDLSFTKRCVLWENAKTPCKTMPQLTSDLCVQILIYVD